uniref:NADH-plastoquinone oxidoreductase subunit J n=1 Tax=Pyrrosia adnascens TaxID=872850 RepID=UPI0026E188A0|nr:NADH-plastoquinone oxidoreductase subunit J [Pyrrosia adnascens]YP_010889839.1 NADH-plastoquinone oxidoreductase subunit J [Pyrrosia hastata]WJJ69600.1 NADH-plastoquinone oxidoreductase subunit J [Pyrrosia adnascens]WJJ69687.1 NADH-plastoquinone oxidoreductase subunit J [Pyrrosia hastata]
MTNMNEDQLNIETRGRLSAWLTRHKFFHRPLGYDYRGVEILQIKSEEWLSVAVAPYAYGFNYLRSQCAYDSAPGGYLVSVYHLTQVRDHSDQLEEVCVKIFVPRINPRIPSVYWIWRGSDFQERESYDMLGIIHQGHPRLRRILMPESWVGWPLRKDYVVPNFYELQDAY